MSTDATARRAPTISFSTRSFKQTCLTSTIPRGGEVAHIANKKQSLTNTVAESIRTLYNHKNKLTKHISTDPSQAQDDNKRPASRLPEFISRSTTKQIFSNTPGLK